MQLGMIGLGRMGANLVERLTRDGHECVVFDVNPAAVAKVCGQARAAIDVDRRLCGEARQATRRLADGAGRGNRRHTCEELATHLEAGDIIIDGGNSYYRDDIQRAGELSKRGIHYVDCGTSGGVFGLERGFCLMIGGEDAVVHHLDPIFRSIAPGVDSAPRTPGRKGPASHAENGYLHCGPNGAGHFVKMVHNGIEYGLMAAYAEGLNILKNADVGLRQQEEDAETTPLRDPDAYKYQLNIGEVAEVWRRGSVIASWLLDLTAAALVTDSELADFSGHVSDSGEGRWTALAAVDEGVPAPVISAALVCPLRIPGRCRLRGPSPQRHAQAVRRS